MDCCALFCGLFCGCWLLMGVGWLLYYMVLHLQYYAQHGLGDFAAVPAFFAISSFAACMCAIMGASMTTPANMGARAFCTMGSLIIWTFLGWSTFAVTLKYSTNMTFSVPGWLKTCVTIWLFWTLLCCFGAAIFAIKSAVEEAPLFGPSEAPDLPSPRAGSKTTAEVISEDGGQCHDDPTLYGRSQLRKWSASNTQWKAFLFTGFPRSLSAVEWCNRNLGMCDPELVGQPSEDAEVMPNLVYVRAECVAQFKERKREPLRQEVTLWRDSNPGKQECNRPRIRGLVEPTGEKEANSSDNEEASGEHHAASAGSASASTSASVAGETQVRLPPRDIHTQNTFVHFPETDRTSMMARSASAPEVISSAPEIISL